MVTRVKNYQKLSRSKKGFLIGKYTLWLGKDHLLYIFSRFGAEDYKRFYFNDIQAIITRKTLAGKLQNIILGCFILMFLVPVFFFDGGWSIFFGAVSGMMSLFLVFNLYKGPTCDTKLLTAVQTEKLYSLNRLKTACRVMDRLQPYIQLAQGTLKPEDLNKIPLRPVDRSAPKGSGAKSGPPEAAAGFEKGRVHMILFGLLIFDGLLAAMEFFITHVVPTVLSSVAVGYVVGIVFAIKNPSIAYNQWEVIKSISNLSPWESPLKMSHNIMVICGALFLGGPGLILLRRENKQVKNPAAIRSAMFKRAIISRTPETG
jgi:hypothetical protein